MGSLDRLSRQLASTVGSAAGPYGYTISLGGSTVLANSRLSSPNLLDVLIMMVGAVLAFLALETYAQGSLAAEAPSSDQPASVWGNVHVPSAGTALAAVWGLVHVLDGAVAWGATGFAATFLYFVVTTIQRLAVDRVRRRHRPKAAAH